MIERRGWHARALRLWLPLGFFLVTGLAPFYWMAVTSLKPNAELYNTHIMPLVVYHPTLKHYVDLLTETSFLTWTWNTTVVAVASTAISLVLGIMLAYPLARMRFAGAGLIAATVAATYLVPQPFLFIPLADIINGLGLSNTLTSLILTYPDDADPVLRLAVDRLFQDGAARTRGGREDRRREPVSDHDAGRAALRSRLHLGWHLCLHPFAERISLRPDLSHQDRRAHGTGGGDRRADPG